MSSFPPALTPWRKSKAGELLGGTVTFRLPNWPATYERLLPLRGNAWDEDRAKRVLAKEQSRGAKIFTGAYEASSSGGQGS
jgi:hypothetical protein